MSFRRARADPARKKTEAWLAETWPTLRELGVSPEVVRDVDCWEDFLENGHLHRMRPRSTFDFTQLSPQQMEGLLGLLEERYATATPLIGWLRAHTNSNG